MLGMVEKLQTKLGERRSIKFDLGKVNIIRELQKPENSQTLEDLELVVNEKLKTKQQKRGKGPKKSATIELPVQDIVKSKFIRNRANTTLLDKPKPQLMRKETINSMTMTRKAAKIPALAAISDGSESVSDSSEDTEAREKRHAKRRKTVTIKEDSEESILSETSFTGSYSFESQEKAPNRMVKFEDLGNAKATVAKNELFEFFQQVPDDKNETNIKIGQEKVISGKSAMNKAHRMTIDIGRKVRELESLNIADRLNILLERNYFEKIPHFEEDTRALLRELAD